MELTVHGFLFMLPPKDAREAAIYWYRKCQITRAHLVLLLRHFDKIADIEDDEARTQACDDIDLEIDELTPLP